MVKRFSVSIDEKTYEKFEKARKEQYPRLSRSIIIEQLIKDFLQEEIYFK